MFRSFEHVFQFVYRQDPYSYLFEEYEVKLPPPFASSWQIHTIEQTQQQQAYGKIETKITILIEKDKAKTKQIQILQRQLTSTFQNYKSMTRHP